MIVVFVIHHRFIHVNVSHKVIHIKYNQIYCNSVFYIHIKLRQITYNKVNRKYGRILYNIMYPCRILHDIFDVLI